MNSNERLSSFAGPVIVLGIVLAMGALIWRIVEIRFEGQRNSAFVSCLMTTLGEEVTKVCGDRAVITDQVSLERYQKCQDSYLGESPEGSKLNRLDLMIAGCDYRAKKVPVL